MEQINTYLQHAQSTALYPSALTGNTEELAYLALGLNGEAGEVAEKIKKKIRDGHLDKENLARELGDVYWYLTSLCAAIGYLPSTVLQMNVNKLSERKAQGTIQGSGDDR